MLEWEFRVLIFHVTLELGILPFSSCWDVKDVKDHDIASGTLSFVDRDEFSAGLRPGPLGLTQTTTSHPSQNLNIQQAFRISVTRKMMDGSRVVQ